MEWTTRRRGQNLQILLVEITDDPADLTGIEEIQRQAIANPNPSEDPTESISSNREIVAVILRGQVFLKSWAEARVLILQAACHWGFEDKVKVI